jgi:hypothetical protein
MKTPEEIFTGAGAKIIAGTEKRYICNINQPDE